MFIDRFFKNRFKMIEKYHTDNIPYRKERCENCVKVLEKCPFGLMLPNIRFDNPIRVFKTGAFHIRFILWAKSATLTAGTWQFPKYHFHSVMLPAPQSGEFPNPFCDSFDEVIPIQTDKWLRYEELGRQEGMKSSGQGCKDAKTKIFCILALLNEQHE